MLVLVVLSGAGYEHSRSLLAYVCGLLAVGYLGENIVLGPRED